MYFKNITKYVSLLLVFVLLLPFAFSCAPKNSEDENNDIDSTEEGKELSEFEATPQTFTLKYINAEHGKLQGTLEQTVKAGGKGTIVRAVPDKGYVFAGWTDNVKNSSRRDENVWSNVEASPIFVDEDTLYTVTYETRMNGKVIDSAVEKATAKKSVSYEAPDAPFAYIHTKWNDGKQGTQRVDNVASDGETYVIEIKPYSLDGVPSIQIFTEDGQGITSRVESKNCTVTLSNTDEKYCFENLSAQVRGRGNSSWNYPKKSIRLKFDSKRSMLGSPYSAKTWILISNYGDKSLLRNMIAYDMSERFSGLDYTVMHEFIDVYLDGEYYGLFMLTDKIDVGEGRVDIDETIHTDPAKTAYIIEIGAANPDTPGTKGMDCFSTERDPNRTYYINYPDTDDPAYDPDVHLAYIEDYINQCLAALSEKNWEKICNLIDVDSFVDYYLLQELFLNKDAFWRSVHFYKEPGGKLHAGPVWDFDQGVGNANDLYGGGVHDVRPDTDFGYVNESHKKTAGSPWVACVSTWNRRLLRNEEFLSLLRTRLKETGPIIADVLKAAETDDSNPNSYYARYNKAMNRNFLRWQIMGQGVWPNTPALVRLKTVKEQIDYMREWIFERYDVLCEYYGVP